VVSFWFSFSLYSIIFFSESFLQTEMSESTTATVPTMTVDTAAPPMMMTGGEDDAATNSRSASPASTIRKNSIAQMFSSLFQLVLPASPTNAASSANATTGGENADIPPSGKRFSLFKRRSLEDKLMKADEPVLKAISEESLTSMRTSSNQDGMPMDQTTPTVNSGEEENVSTKEIRKRQSSRKFLGLSKEKSQKYEITEDMINLQRIISDKNHRQRLIELLLPLDGDSSVKVRFCSAVEEYQREKDKEERTRKGAHIVKTFVKQGSMFRLTGIPKE